MPARRRRVRLGLLLGAAVLALPPPAASALAARWRWPVRGPIAEAYRYREATPFARGQRRGIVIAAPSGAAIRAACPGRVTFAGRLGGRGGRAVTVVCGALTATYLRLAALAVHRASVVAVGDRLGRLGDRGLHLGARRTGDRWGYVDPRLLLGDDPRARPVPPLPAGRRPAGPPALGPRPALALAAHPAAVPLHMPRGASAAAAATETMPVVVWLGLVLLAASMPTLGLVGARRRRRRHRRRGAATRAGAYAPADAA